MNMRLIFLTAFITFMPLTLSGQDLNPTEPQVLARASEMNESPPPQIPEHDFRGWRYLAEKLIDHGISPHEVEKAFLHPRMPKRTPVTFKLKPRETRQMYNHFTTEARLKIAEQCLRDGHAAFIAAERDFNVSRYALAALLLVETQCGRVLGTNMIFNRIARVASIGEPSNLEYNYKLLKKEDPTITRDQVAARAEYLETTFFPELPALFSIAKMNNLSVFDIGGSSAGAFGIPQFLPSSFLKFAVDGDKNGSTSLFTLPDAVASAANFLNHFGWKDEDIEAKKKALFNYNRSEAYGEAVLKVSILVKQKFSASAPEVTLVAESVEPKKSHNTDS